MSMFKSVRNELRLSGSVFALFAAIGAASAQNAGSQAPATTPADATPAQNASPQAPAVPPPGATPIPEISVTAPKQTPQRTAARPAAPRPAAAPAPTPAQVQAEANRQVVTQTQTLDQRRDEVLLPKTGTDTTALSQKDIENMPQGNNLQVSDLLYQLPGVTQDSTSSGDFHIRNEHGNTQFRVNGILLPDGVAGYSQFLETGFIKSMTLITGAMPAQYGLHTSGIVDITTKSGDALSGGSVSVYGGSRQTITPSFEYGGVAGKTDYFFTGRFLDTSLGLENPTSSLNALHDHTEMGRFFGYTSTMLDESTRLSSIVGVSVQKYQIPDNPGQALFGLPSAFGVNTTDSANINQQQYEKNAFSVLAWQRSVGDVDLQLAYYNRYSDVHFVPDPVGDLLFNGVASDVFRSSFLNGVSGDGAWRLNDAHTLRGGFFVQGEQTQIKNFDVAATVDSTGAPTSSLVSIADGSNLFGWQLGGYVQDEWRLTDKLTFNYGLRFDQMFQYVDANQFSPRASFTYKPWWSSVFHVGYMRTFTPPPQVLGRPFQSQVFDGSQPGSVVTTAAGPTPYTGSPILPERAHVVDVGIMQQLLPQCPTVGGIPVKAPGLSNCPGLEVGVDAYYKRAQDLLDDGQFGQAYVLTAFNYEKAENYGIEMKAKFTWGNFTAYTNLAVAQQHANTVVSNQSLFGPDELAYIQTHWINTDHSQVVTGSAGVSYLWDGTGNYWIDGTKASASMIYGSGLRSGFANTDHLPAYGQVNLGLSHEFKNAGWNAKSLTVRFDVVNLFDTIYEIRDGSGIGVFAPQFGPRRGFYFGLTQKL
jgi:outer membrane receptor protein involved in Fe transport